MVENRWACARCHGLYWYTLCVGETQPDYSHVKSLFPVFPCQIILNARSTSELDDEVDDADFPSGYIWPKSTFLCKRIYDYNLLHGCRGRANGYLPNIGLREAT